MNWHLILTAMLPENILLLGIVLLIGHDIVASRPPRGMVLSVATAVAATVAATWLRASGFSDEAFPGHFSIGPGPALAKAVVLGLTVPVLLLAREDFRDSRFHILVLSSLYGVCMMLSAESFLTLFLGLEIMSMPVYVLVLLAYRRAECAEAALKYLVLGGAATATLLMGVSLLYGASGSLALVAFGDALGAGQAIATAGAVLVIVAFFLKAAVVPFHAWAPDAYEAASVPVTAFMATIVKAGVLLAAARIFATAQLTPGVVGLIAMLPLVSIVWGNLAAMKQPGFRRMIAYSSIAHAGYLFYAFLGEGGTRFQAVLFYVIAYGLMNVLAFAALPRSDRDADRDRLVGLKGLFHRDPYAALLIGAAMLSLAGIPPFPGFVAKFLIFKNVVAAGYTTYAVLGLVGSYLGIYFYLRVIQYMFMSTDEEIAAAPAAKLQAAGSLAIWASVLCLVPAILLAVFPGWVIGRL